MAALRDDSFWTDGPRPGGFYQMHPRPAPAMPITRSAEPSVTGTSVLGLKFKGGVVLAADTCGSYGSLARFRTVSRLKEVNASCALGASGDLADFHALSHLVDTIMTENAAYDDGHTLSPRAVHSFITRVLYNKRSKFDPWWNTVVVGGYHGGQAFLGYVDKIGVAFTDNHVASGYGAHIAMPLMRSAYEANPEMSEAEALAVVRKCMHVLFYRDARAVNKYDVTVVTAEGVRALPQQELETNWDICHMVKGYE